MFCIWRKQTRRKSVKACGLQSAAVGGPLRVLSRRVCREIMGDRSAGALWAGWGTQGRENAAEKPGFLFPVLNSVAAHLFKAFSSLVLTPCLRHTMKDLLPPSCHFQPGWRWGGREGGEPTDVLPAPEMVPTLPERSRSSCCRQRAA